MVELTVLMLDFRWEFLGVVMLVGMMVLHLDANLGGCLEKW